MADQFTIADAAITYREAWTASERAMERCEAGGGDNVLHAECARSDAELRAARAKLFAAIDAHVAGGDHG
jgi:hypothetical protein